jgi:YesN/AraC family two-component response regulator
MPEMNGLDLLSIMKRAVYRDLPIIMMSGSSDHELVRQCFRGGAQDFMAKPVHRSDLESRLQSAFFEREQQRRDRTYRRWTTLTVDNISSHGDTSSSDSLQMDHYPAIVVSEHVDNHVEEGPNGIDIDSLRITDRDAAIEGHLEEVLELATDSDVER